jgi:gamma-glutamylcyclotransferase (GGCT)/AIG2-like uncharacterized protein YtfP
MLAERLQARCASAKVIGTASVHGYELSFAKIGPDGSGKATLVRNENSAQQIQGVVFSVAKSELATLDWFEGERYNRINEFQVFATGGIIPAVTYIAPSAYRDTAQQPYDWYLALILAGALQHGFDGDYVSFVKQITMAKPDPIPDREGRLQALAALEKSGYSYLLGEVLTNG